MTWWRGAVGYEVYIRSFADSNGDGVGDLRGLHDRLDHLAWLGIDIVWITPFYPSPMHDHGYDVADYTGVDPVFGAMADLDAVVEKAHGLGLRVVVDLVPNHSSSEHRWFRESRSSRDNPYRDYYLWSDPAPDGGPPNNWVSHFGGLAWTLDETTGQYWCHLFLPEQPDLNWANEAVRAEFDDILRFWLDRGVDGFRIDVAHQLVKHPDLPDNPVADEPDDVEMGTTASIWETLEHRYDSDQPGTVEIYRRWRKVADPYDALLLGEVYLLEAEHFERYVRDDDGLNLAFWFTPLHVGWDVDLLRRALVDGAGFRRGGVAWVSGSHDRPRAVSRFGGGEVGRRRALVLSTLLFGMPGTPFLYQGEELGLPDGVITPEEAQDPIAVRTGELEHSRDVCRTPMPWTPGPGLGFTTAARAWLPFGNRVETDTVAVQRADESSTIHRYRRLVGLRRETADLHTEPVEWLTEEGPLIAYRRGATIVAANGGAQAVALELPEGTWTIVFDTTAATESADAGRTLELAGHQAVVLRRG